MGTKKKENKAVLSKVKNKLTVENVYTLLDAHIDQIERNRIFEMLKLESKLEMLKELVSKQNISVNLFLPEKKPWYKRLFGK